MDDAYSIYIKDTPLNSEYHGDSGRTMRMKQYLIRQAFEDNVELPADGFVIGKPVSVIEIDYDGNERRGLTARCRRENGSVHVVVVFEIVFPKGSAGAWHIAAYRKRLNLDPFPA